MTLLQNLIIVIGTMYLLFLGLIIVCKSLNNFIEAIADFISRIKEFFNDLFK